MERPDTDGPSGELEDVVRRFRGHPGLLGKSSLRLVSEVFGTGDWLRGPGDDAAAIAHGDEHLLVAGEAMWPPYVKADPFAAGLASVVANVNDVAAMGGRAVALVDTVVGPQEAARRALEGLREGAAMYGVPVVGGHLTVHHAPPALSVFVLGRARALLPATAVAPGQALLTAAALEGYMRKDFPFFSSLRERRAMLAGDVEILPRLAEAGRCAAAKDVSMAGLLGSLAMLLEATGCGALVDLERLPRPAEIPVGMWTASFPSYGFLLTAPADRADECRQAFEERGLGCQRVGEIDDTGDLRVRWRGQTATVTRITQGVTGLRRA